MYIKEGVITGYTYELYYDSNWLYSSVDHDDVFDTEEEAMEDANSEIDDRIEQWKSGNAWDEKYDSRDQFYIDIVEIVDDEEEDGDE